MDLNPQDLSRHSPPPRLTTRICVIGSGCGGATAARVLAEAGHEVVVLEEGADLTGKELEISEGRRYDQLYMDRGGRMTEDMSVSVLQGRALGGGGVVNASDVVPMTDALIDFWRRRFGLAELTPEALAPYRERALSDLSASRIEERALNRGNQLLRQGAEALGLRGEAMLHNRVGCQGLGQCLLGCPANAKRNPRFVSIPRAIRHDARFLLRARAVRIEQARDELKRITVRILDPGGYREIGEFEVRAQVVILAANAINTAQLLLRSGLGNEHVGRNLTLQPQLPLLAEFEERLESFYGIPQAYAVTHFEEPCHEQHGLWGFRIEAVMGTPGMVSSMLPATGLEAKEMMSLYPRITGSLLLVPDEPSGMVRIRPGGRPIISYEQKPSHQARLRSAIREGARIYLAAGARRVFVPVIPPLQIRSEKELAALEHLEFLPAAAPLVSAHQQGTARFSPSPETGACSPDGLIWGTRDVYAFDSSGFPTSSSTHTMAPIITMAHYLAERLVARLG